MASLNRMGARQFIEELRELQANLAAEIEAKARNLDPSPEAIKARRKRVLNDGDYWFFATTYFPHHIWGEPSKFHSHFSRRFPQLLRSPMGCKEWWLAPRGESKTTLLTKIGPCWIAVQHLLQLPKVREEVEWTGVPPPSLDYGVLVGAEAKMPTKLLAVVKTELEVNRALALDFPEVCGRSRVWKIGEIVTRNGVKIEPFGAEQAVRGTFHGAHRPTWAMSDDIITDKEAKSPTERDNRWNWLEQAIKYLGPPDGSMKFLSVNTSLNKDDPVGRADSVEYGLGHVVHHFKGIVKMPRRMDLWEKCEEIMRNEDKVKKRESADRGEVCQEQDLPSYKFYARRKKMMDAGAEVSWPAVRPIYTMMAMRASNRKAFETEIQGNPRDDSEKVFQDPKIWVHRGDRWIFLGACDPSMGKGETGHPSAILVGGYDLNTRKLNVVEAGIKRRTASKLLADLKGVQEEYGCTQIGFENNNAYEFMRQQFVNDALLGHDPVALPLVGITATQPAEVRIDGLEPFINGDDPLIWFSASLRSLLDELDTWPEPQSHHHYDGLSALVILWDLAVARRWGGPQVRAGGHRNRMDMRGHPS